MTDIRLVLGKNIKIHRKICDFSQSKLAERVNTATNYISAIEAGRRFPSVEILEKIAVALGIDTPELFSMEQIKLEMTKNELEVKIWQDIGDNITDYIGNKLNGLKNR
jgi:transcriptional regulator with XRE-family HTH domain